MEDVIRGQWGPEKVEATIRATAQADGKRVKVGIEKDPAQAGTFEADYYRRALLGYDFEALPPQGSKEVRARPLASQVRGGNVYLVRGPWVPAWLLEYASFPLGKYDDQVDGGSGAFRLASSDPYVADYAGGEKRTTTRGGIRAELRRSKGGLL